MTERFMHIPGRRAETSKLIERLKYGKPGDRVTDAELSAIAGADTSPSGGGYGWLHSAIATCVRDHSVVWQRVRHAGYLECLDADRLEKVGRRSLRSIRKKARVTSRRLVCADLTSATPEVKQGLIHRRAPQRNASPRYAPFRNATLRRAAQRSATQRQCSPSPIGGGGL